MKADLMSCKTHLRLGHPFVCNLDYMDKMADSMCRLESYVHYHARLHCTDTQIRDILRSDMSSQISHNIASAYGHFIKVSVSSTSSYHLH